MNRILVPVDFSDQAKYACKAAASIAKKTKSEIILLHMFDVPSETIDPGNSSSSNSGAQAIYYMKGVHKKFEEFMAFSFFDGLDVKEDVRFHKAFEGVIEESRKLNVDLIVMGSQGATGLKEMLVGSNTEKVVRLSHIPVLVIKEDLQEFNVKDIVFASDFSEETKKSFPKVLEFRDFFDAKLHLLYINTVHKFESTKKSNQRLYSFIDNYELKNYSMNVYNDSTIEEGILNFSREIDADIIAINTHGRSGLYNLFSESISKDLANHALRPVITFKI
ncbi:MAG: universal stress protein [Flavobacteriaceae bacterium]|nr:universal stress protein [Flavobacteriaceae bacterium]